MKTSTPSNTGFRLQPGWGKLLLFASSLFLFVLSILLMKEGARDLVPWLRSTLLIHNPASSLGFGWLFSYIVLSGSPVAATALTFMEAGLLDPTSTFFMIIGSRLGASFIVLFLGFIYVLRGRDRETSLGMGFLALTVTAAINLSALVIGLPLLRSGLLERIALGDGASLASTLEKVFAPLVGTVVGWLPGWAVFLVGLLIILVSFGLLDRSLPKMSLKQSQLGRVSRLVYRPWVMLIFGAGITLISMSVSVSLAVLVPLSARGFVRRENVIPYIMGANITTFIDTLLASLLLENPAARTVVLACMVSVLLVSMLILLLGYGRFEAACLRLVGWLVQRSRNLFIAIILIILLPILLLIL